MAVSLVIKDLVYEAKTFFSRPRPRTSDILVTITKKIFITITKYITKTKNYNDPYN